jgi:hypothetical protein
VTGRPPVDDLDELLGAWAEARRLTDSEAKAILATVLVTPLTLDPMWWRDLVAQVSAVVVRATTMPQPAMTAIRQPLTQPAAVQASLAGPLR